MKRLLPFIIVSVYFLASSYAYSQNTDDAIKELKKRYPVLMKTYADKLQSLQVEYIVAIDLSGSMNKKIPNGTSSYIEEVKRGIISFLSAIPDNSKISIIGFGATVRWVQIPTVINDANRSSISRVLNDLKADEGYTDLKGAVNFLEEGCSSTSTIKYLFAFTDFNNNPPATSPFLKTSWETLQQKFALISKTSLIEAFALKLPLEASSGRDLPSIRIVFPGLNVIEFDATSLQNWFSDRSGKLMEQNLWTFVSGELKRINERHSLNLKARLRYDGKLAISAKPDSLSSLFSGIDFFALDSISISPGNKFRFSSGKLAFDNPKINIGSVSRNESWYPFGIVKRLSGIVKGKMITNAEQELEMLFPNVTVSSRAGQDLSIGLNEYLTYSSPVSVKGGFIIFWPVWAFAAAVILLIVIIVLTLINSILSYKLKRYALRINGGDLIRLEGWKKYKISSTRGDFVVSIPDELELEIYGALGDPFNLIVKKTIAMRIEKGKPNISFNGTLQTQRISYRLPLHQEILVSEGTSQLTLEFFKA